jgi:hypothetical protein
MYTNNQSTGSGTLINVTTNLLPTIKIVPITNAFAVINTSGQGITLTWSGSTNATVFTYTLASGTVISPDSQNYATNPYTATFKSLTPATLHTITITPSAISTSTYLGSTGIPVDISFTTPPNSVTGLESTSTTSSITVSWIPPSNVSNYICKLGNTITTPNPPITSSSTSATFTNLQPNTSYNVIIIAVSSVLSPNTDNQYGNNVTTPNISVKTTSIATPPPTQETTPPPTQETTPPPTQGTTTSSTQESNELSLKSPSLSSGSTNTSETSPDTSPDTFTIIIILIVVGLVIIGIYLFINKSDSKSNGGQFEIGE